MAVDNCSFQFRYVTNKTVFTEATVIDVVSTVINESSRTALELDCKQSLFCSKISWEECKSSERASMTGFPTPTLITVPGFATCRSSVTLPG